MAANEQTTDAEIITQVLAGDQAQYRFLVERHHRAVFNAAYRLLGNETQAADITQEAFLRAYNALATFRREAVLAPWLCRIAINLALNTIKRTQPTLSLDLEQEGQALAAPDLSAEPQQRLLQQEQNDMLYRAILALPPDQRAVIELRHFQDLSYDEIAAALNISTTNVKSRLFRGRQALRQMLQKEL